jgi:iron complex outermembrane recepter protein
MLMFTTRIGAPPASGKPVRSAGLLAATVLATIAHPAAAQVQLDPLTVTGSKPESPTGTIGQPPAPFAGGQVGSGTRLGMLGNRDVFDTPFNVTGYTNELITNQQARTVSDVLDNDPSVRTNSARYSGIDGFLIRGFPVFSTEIGFDGLYGIVDQRRPAIEPAERVEILKGPSVLLSGVPIFGNIGGSINYIPKRATDEPLARLSGSFASAGQFGGHADFGRRFGESKEWGVRANVAYRDGATPIDFQKERFGVAALALDYRGEQLRATVDVGYQQQDVVSPSRVRTVAPGIQIPASPALTINPGQPWESYTGNSRYGAARIEYDLLTGLTAYAAIGGSHFQELFFGGVQRITTASGNFTTVPQQTPTFSRNGTIESGLRGEFETGPLKHRAAFAAVGLWRDSGITATNLAGGTITSNIYNPVYVAPRAAVGPTSAPLTARRINRSVGLSDTMSMYGDRIVLTAGGRWQEIEVQNYSGTTGALTSEVTNKAFSPAFGLVIKPIPRLSLYGNYVEGLTAPDNAPITATNAGQAFPAMVSRQKEVGAKYDFGRLGLSAAAFEITQPNAFTDPATNLYGVDGEQRNRGLEFNIFGEIAEGTRLLGGVTFLDGVQTKTAGGSNDGKVAVGVPDTQLNLYGEYDLPFWRTAGLMTLTGRVIHTAAQYYDQANTQAIPHWTRVDVGARYAFSLPNGTPLVLRASVENVFGQNYWATTGRGFLTPGTPRTYLLSASVDF